ncbi:MAG: hypothetical protein C0602_11755 [Denitrovibrio sp.]|nr:MAG: hypothetical protein C0602_11755 [Denitrovibrio sp.]
MQYSGTIKSIIDFSNFFDHQLYIFSDKDMQFLSIKNGQVKQIKFPQHLQKVLNDRYTFSKTISSGGEKSVLHIFRLGDGHTLFLNDPGTGTVLNGFVLSLITLSSNACDDSPDTENANGDMNSILLDKLVAEFDNEKRKFSVINKRQKEEIIILEEQAKEAYNQFDAVSNQLKKKDSEIQTVRQNLATLAESYKNIEKQLTDAKNTGDFNIGSELKKKNEALRESNKQLVEMLKKSTLSISEVQSEVEMCIKDIFENSNIPSEKKTEVLNSLNEIFSTEAKKLKKEVDS